MRIRARVMFGIVFALGVTGVAFGGVSLEFLQAFGGYGIGRQDFDRPVVPPKFEHTDGEVDHLDVVGGNGKGLLTFAQQPKPRLGLDLQAASDRLLRGDEGNDVGTIPGHVVVNAQGSSSITESLRISVSVNNLLDAELRDLRPVWRREDVLGEEFDDSRFLSPGAPRGAWIGLERAIE